MTSVFRIIQRSCRLSTSLLVSAIYLVTSACSFIQSTAMEEVVVDGPHGAVFLQNVEDGWFRTAHPLSLSPDLLKSVLEGVSVQTSLVDTATTVRVFSDEDVEFLIPQLSTTLARADKRQVVGFRVTRDAGAGCGTTDGILYVQGRLLHLTFTHYQAQEEQPGGSSQMVQNPTELDSRHMRFAPESARRSSRHEQPDITKTPPLASLVIAYEALPSWSVPLTGQAAATQKLPVAPAGPTGSAHGAVKENEAELEALRKEVRALQRRLSELDLQLTNSKKR